MGKDSINDVVKAFKQGFGNIEYEAVNNKTGQVVRSPGWRSVKESGNALNAEQYLNLKQYGDGDDS